MDSRDALHRQLMEVFDFVEDYGRNLDALHDSLGELKDVQVVLRYKQAMLNSLGVYGQKLLDVFRDTALSKDDFRFSSLD
jgi:RNAse (barnase) inhibitor barstar